MLLGLLTNARAQSTQSLIESLASSRAEAREQAEAQLLRMGAEARPALLKASRLNNPSISSAATRLLMRLNWFLDSDPQEAQAMLGQYGTGDIQQRIAIVNGLFFLENRGGHAAMLRLLVEDPSDEVGWAVVRQMRTLFDPDSLKKMQAINPDNRAPATAILGWSWNPLDHEKAVTLFRQAMEIDFPRPALDGGEVDEIADAAANSYVLRNDLAQAAEVRRMQASRAALAPQGQPLGVYQLFLLHGWYGPLTGLDQDVQTYVDYLGDATVQYALSRAYARAGRMAESLACESAANVANASTMTHLRAASFFASVGALDRARKEAYLSLAAPYAPSRDKNELDAFIDPFLQRITARQLLSGVAAMEEDDDAAIEHSEALVKLLDEIGLPLVRAGRRGPDQAFDPPELAMEIAWRKARLAQRAGDKEAMLKNLDGAMAFPGKDSETVLSIYPMLKSVGRDADAERMFLESYNEKKSLLEKTPHDPSELNNLAWLCARCSQNLPEALDYANRAVKTKPNEAAYLDTLAEVYFRMGNFAEAVKQEELALLLRPEDTFMKNQRDRFKAARDAK